MFLFHKAAEFRAHLARAWALSVPYFRSEERWKARGLLAAIVALNLGFVYVLVLINDWNGVFYDALQNKDYPVFLAQLGRFSLLAGAYIAIAVYRFYLTQLLEMRWRAWMTRTMLRRWLGHQAFYQLELARHGPTVDEAVAPDNPDQRIQEDLRLFTSSTVALSMGLLNAVVTLASFAGILWGLSGSFSFSALNHDLVVPGFMLWVAVLYCVAGTVVAHYVGRRLIPLNYEQQHREADFRHQMVRVREYSEAIALDRGESVEYGQLDGKFTLVLANYFRLINAQKRLTLFTALFGQASVVFPFVVAAPRFFSGAIQLGTLMQIASAFNRVQDSLSWFIDSYDDLAAWRATTDRLSHFDAALARMSSAPALDWSESASRVQADRLTVRLPDGRTLLQSADFQIEPGERIVLGGPSGSGKSTLFRALAGIWRRSTGRVALPSSRMFIPQRPYFPDAPLRDALAYPDAASHYSDEALGDALRQALLPQWSTRLDEVHNWSQTMSGGEQQRLALARVFLKRPAWVFADEATSALDEASEQELYRRLLKLVEEEHGAIISIAHRPAVAGFHSRQWTLAPGADAAMTLVQTPVQARAAPR